MGTLHPPLKARIRSPSFLPMGISPPSPNTPSSGVGRDRASPSLPGTIAFQNTLHRFCSTMRSPHPSTLPDRRHSGVHWGFIDTPGDVSCSLLPSAPPQPFAFQTPVPSQFSTRLSSLTGRLRGTSRKPKDWETPHGMNWLRVSVGQEQLPDKDWLSKLGTLPLERSRSSGEPESLGWLQMSWGQTSAPNRKGHWGRAELLILCSFSFPRTQVEGWVWQVVS